MNLYLVLYCKQSDDILVLVLIFKLVAIYIVKYSSSIVNQLTGIKYDTYDIERSISILKDLSADIYVF